MTDGQGIRHSRAESASLVADPIEKAKLEASNSLKQAERVRQYVLSFIDGDRPFRLRPSMLLDLNRCAIKGLDAYAGVWRPGGVEIGKSAHTPPGGHIVPELVEEMCDYVNDNWTSSTAIHLSALVMWRLNWIHPFTEGNGRTSRAVSYLVLCAKSGSLFPGDQTIPVQIVENRAPYYTALEAGDTVYAEQKVLGLETVSEMEQLLGGMFAKQLLDAVKVATGE